jgi:hypothetical protein
MAKKNLRLPRAVRQGLDTVAAVIAFTPVQLMTVIVRGGYVSAKGRQPDAKPISS